MKAMRSEDKASALLADEPFLFYQDPPDWRWMSFAEAGRQIQMWRDRFADLEPAAACGEGPVASPEVLLCDLAARSAGLVTARLSDLELDAEVDRLQAAIGLAGVPVGRDVLVHGRPLEDRGERVVVEWAVRSAAAIVVAPSPEMTAATAFWVRPTILHGRADELSAWPDVFRAGEGSDRGLRARFKRLRHVVVGGGALEAGAEAFYTGLGARVVMLGGL